ncbi:MAG: hypothetical protein ACR2F6_09360 [Mycobacteriales bacterium]
MPDRLVVDRRRNGLNTVRLALAASVLGWHSFLLTGRTSAARLLGLPRGRRLRRAVRTAVVAAAPVTRQVPARAAGSQPMVGPRG